MTADEFRANKELVIGLRAALAEPAMALAMEVLAEDETENPVLARPDELVTPHYAHIQLGQQVGYAQYPKRLKLLARHPETEPMTTDEPHYLDSPEQPPAEE